MRNIFIALITALSSGLCLSQPESFNVVEAISHAEQQDYFVTALVFGYGEVESTDSSTVYFNGKDAIFIDEDDSLRYFAWVADYSKKDFKTLYRYLNTLEVGEPVQTVDNCLGMLYSFDDVQYMLKYCVINRKKYYALIAITEK
jgi:hypothetical protein